MAPPSDTNGTSERRRVGEESRTGSGTQTSHVSPRRGEKNGTQGQACPHAEDGAGGLLLLSGGWGRRASLGWERGKDQSWLPLCRGFLVTLLGKWDQAGKTTGDPWKGSTVLGIACSASGSPQVRLPRGRGQPCPDWACDLGTLGPPRPRSECYK